MKHKAKALVIVFGAVLALGGMAAGQGCDEPDSVKRVTKSRSGPFEYVTFEMVSNAPNYTVATARPPFEAGESGEKLPVKGRYFKSIQFKSVHWMCRIDERLGNRTTNIMDVKNSYQFEGDLVYIAGYRTRSKYVGHYVTGKGTDRSVIIKFRR